MDFQDESWELVLREDHALPYLLSGDEVNSGPLWYAFYGWKGATVFERHTATEIHKVSPLPMQHDGRFLLTNKLSGVVASFSNATIIYENPYGHSTLPLPVQQHLTMLPQFSEHHSILSFKDGDLSDWIAAVRVELEHMVGVYLYRESPYYY
ncbi:hypothetical protein D3C73_1122970 [compost metagenome]